MQSRHGSAASGGASELSQVQRDAIALIALALIGYELGKRILP